MGVGIIARVGEPRCATAAVAGLFSLALGSCLARAGFELFDPEGATGGGSTECASLGVECGTTDDGSGNLLVCGSCSAPEACGGGGTPGRCGCTPATCATVAEECGTVSDGCFGTLNCGPCSGTDRCGALGFCGPADNVIILSNYEGGTYSIDVDINVPNLAIGIVSYDPSVVAIGGTFAGNVVASGYAGSSDAPATSISGIPAGMVTIEHHPPSPLSGPEDTEVISFGDQGGAAYSGSSNTKAQIQRFFIAKFGGQIWAHRCQYDSFWGTLAVSAIGDCPCVPWICADWGAECGPLADGCGGMLDCGDCPAPETCGGLGVANRCGGCSPNRALAGPRYPGVVSVDSSVGSVTWTLPNAAALSDDSRAVAMGLVNGVTSHYLKATGFGFHLPATSTVHGIYVIWERSAGFVENAMVDAAVRIVNGGAVGAEDRASTAFWSLLPPDRLAAYGDGADLWGLAWDPAAINDSGFGAAVAVSYTRTAGNGSAYVDSVRMLVCHE